MSTAGMAGGPSLKMDCVTPKRRRRRSRRAEQPELPEEVRDRLAGVLDEEALEEAVQGLKPEDLTGPGGLLTQLAGRVIEAALQAELSEHLGYPPGESPPEANKRNGGIPKTLKTDLGPVEMRTPRDRDASFQPQLVRKRQTGLAGLDERVLDMYAGGMSTRDIASHLTSLYGVAVSADTISRVTDSVLEDIASWRSRPLDELYPIVYFDAMTVKVREDRSVQNRCCYLAVGVTLEGERDCLGIWWREKEGARFWLAVLNDLHQRGVGDILIACVDGLTGFPEAIATVFPDTWVQTCIVHEIRASTKYVAYQDRKKVTAALRPIYTAANEHDALAELERFDQEWGAKYPMIAQLWRRDWEHITPFLSLPAPLRKAVYTTNSIEGMHRQVRKAIKTRGHFPDEQAATKLIWLAIQRSETKWRSVLGWTTALRALKIHFGDRIPD
jgi:putative transposase